MWIVLLQMKIVCGTLESLGYAVSTLLQLMSLYQGKDEITIPTLLVGVFVCVRLFLCISEARRHIFMSICASFFLLQILKKYNCIPFILFVYFTAKFSAFIYHIIE